MLLALARAHGRPGRPPLLDRVGAADLSEHEMARLRRPLVDAGPATRWSG